jgi:SAM-dependent methyltransferase
LTRQQQLIAQSRGIESYRLRSDFDEVTQMSAEEIYAAMQQTHMIGWVGGGDAAAAGAANFGSIIETLPLRRDHVVFDFGCGIGRTTVPLAEFLNEGGRVVGSDIVPGMIQFCQEQLEHSFPNTAFYCLQATNPIYDHLATATKDSVSFMDEAQFFLRPYPVRAGRAPLI